MPRKRKTGPRTTWTAHSGNALVGTTISVAWPTDNTYYSALVLDFFPRHSQHKILYYADESIETLQLGNGPGQREYHAAAQPDDDLVGHTIVLNDRQGEASAEWFHFMRPDEEDVGDKFEVTIVAAIPVAHVDVEDVSGPRREDGDHRYYRIIYRPNEYLATIDLAAIDYNRATPTDTEPAPQADADTLGDSITYNDDDKPILADHDALERTDGKPVDAPDVIEENEKFAFGDDDQGEEEKDASDDAYLPPKDVDVAEDDSDTPTTEHDRRVSAGAPDEKPVDADPGPEIAPVDDFEVDIDIDKVAKVVSADRVVTHDRGQLETDGRDSAEEGGDSLPGEQPEVGSRVMGEGSIGTQETQDEPLDRGGEKQRKPTAPNPLSLYPTPFEDEEGNVTASDDDKAEWGSGRSEGSKAQVGDYISLNTEIGYPRKAFIEAYLPETGTHFVAFCDSRGGTLQIKLTKENHEVLNEDEVGILTRNEVRDDTPEIVEVPSNRGARKRQPKRRARSPAKPKPRKRAQRTPEVKGQSADEKICGRCISIVWPVENLVYVALVLGYSSHSNEHQIVYMVDHCVETLNLKYREWTLLPREKEPWISTGMVGKRLYVFWEGSYDDDLSQAIATKKFGGRTRVPYEAYVLSYIGDGKYKIIYTAAEDTETRELHVEDDDKDLSPIEKEWDLLEEGAKDVDGLPIIGWTD